MREFYLAACEAGFRPNSLVVCSDSTRAQTGGNLGHMGIRVNAISAGPATTRAACGLVGATDTENIPPEHDPDTLENRRDFLYYATAGSGAVATGAAVWPMIHLMIPSADVLSLLTLRVDLPGMEHGQRITVGRQGMPVFVWRRSQAAIDAARATPLAALADQTDSVKENPNQTQPEPALDQNRTADEAGEWPTFSAALGRELFT